MKLSIRGSSVIMIGVIGSAATGRGANESLDIVDQDCS